MKRSSSFGVGDGDGDAVAVGEAVVVVVVPVVVVVVPVVVGDGEGEEGVVMGTGVVVSCASTVVGSFNSARSANPAAKTARNTMNIFSTARVRSVISPPAIA